MSTAARVVRTRRSGLLSRLRGGRLGGALGRCLLRRRLLRGLLRRALLGCWTLRALLGQQLRGPLQRDRRLVVTLAQRRVVLAVGDVGTEAAGLHGDLRPRRRVLTDLPTRLGGRPATLLRLGIDRKRLLQRDR